MDIGRAPLLFLAPPPRGLPGAPELVLKMASQCFASLEERAAGHARPREPSVDVFGGHCSSRRAFVCTFVRERWGEAISLISSVFHQLIRSIAADSPVCMKTLTGQHIFVASSSTLALAQLVDLTM